MSRNTEHGKILYDVDMVRGAKEGQARVREGERGEGTVGRR